MRQAKQMDYTILILAFALILAMCKAAKGETFDGNTPLHVGVAGALTGGLYLTFSAFTGRREEAKVPSLVSAMVFAGAGCFLSELTDTDHTPGHRLDGGDLAADALGIVLMGTIIYFVDIHGGAVKARPHPRGVAFEL